jgi:hypothetical protein
VLAATDLSDKTIRSLQGWTHAHRVHLDLPRGEPAIARGASGFRVAAADVAGLSVKERCELLVNVGRAEYGANEVDTLVMGPRTWMQLSQEVQDFGWTTFGKTMEIGAGEIVIITANGLVRVLNEPHCKEADIWALTMPLLKIYNYNGFPGPRDDDGLKMLRNGKTTKCSGRRSTALRWVDSRRCTAAAAPETDLSGVGAWRVVSLPPVL